MVTFDVLGFLGTSQDTGHEECLQNDLVWVE